MLDSSSGLNWPSIYVLLLDGSVAPNNIIKYEALSFPEHKRNFLDFSVHI